ncbi:fumarylacetoacetate hydrolase family protein [Lentzea albida]|uniref:Fumarylacetoacetate (FAA) hydrolase family protein n=1 Tax=Lentzea albida TaxID=65499 RepID=A0A1H9PQ93_9PSEU|nr:fumarylacetoacetate hydrolase family protein [Lentzea albida]SER49975.1 Fumarylacetoacetate (FAA) hydrolase family protein [Lentzea albida]
MTRVIHTAFIGGDIVPAELVPQPHVTAGVGFVLKEDLGDGPLDDAQVREAIAYGVAVIEVCGGRGAFVTGPRRVALRDFDPTQVRMSLHVNGTEVATGGAADPLGALALRARASRDRGNPLRAGEMVFTGALGPLCALVPGDVVTAHLSGLGAVKMYFGHREP